MIKITIKDLEEETDIHKAIVKDMEELSKEIKKLRIKWR